MYTYGQICGYKHIRHRFKRLPKLDKADIKPVWSMGHYDGIMSALVMYKGMPCFAECQMDPSDKSKYRRFFVTRIKEDEYIKEQIIHALFRAYVGTHCDLDDDWHRDSGPIVSNKFHPKFYEHELARNRKAEPVSDDDECFGWFEGFYKE